MNIIAEITKDCARDDCSVNEGMSTSTCMGWIRTYDKQGNRTDRGDPNIHTTQYSCWLCNRQWSVSTKYGETKIREIKTEAAQSAE